MLCVCFFCEWKDLWYKCLEEVSCSFAVIYIYNVCVVFGDPGKGKNKLQCEVKGNTWSNTQFFTGWDPVFQGSITLKMLSIQAIFLEFKR